MTDEELLAKVAEIEGCEWDGHGFLAATKQSDDGDDWNWNPLTNRAQALELMEMYRLDAYWINGSDDKDGNKWWVRFWRDHSGVWGKDPSLPRAICLAIVEANS